MNIHDYISAIRDRFKTGLATEHTYRGDLQSLLGSLVSDIVVTNEPRRQACGAPDYIITKNGIPIGYVEAKDLSYDLDKAETSEQLSRYRKSLENLILTDYIEFRLYRTGLPTAQVRIASVESGKVKPLTENSQMFQSMIHDFCSYTGQTVKSPEKLARMMADKARLMEETIYRALTGVQKDDISEDTTLHDQLEAFRRILIHDMNERQFADIYAQTIAYGLFAARLHDPTRDTFSRQEAGYLVPKSNPFLFQLFTYIAGPTLDDRIAWIVDALADVFRASDVRTILAEFGKETFSTDPFIHFYETFLAAYDPVLKRSRGVYYTPEPIVSFIARSADAILQRDFNLPSGLADTSTIELDKQGPTGKIKEFVHRVQILDPATGTGTFLMEVFKLIYARFEKQQGLWNSYVDQALLPRVYGFEILMAPYTMCHLKLELFLKQTGYTPRESGKPARLRVYLTNSLEEVQQDKGSLFASWLAKEATDANIIKRDAPVMVVLGNPPYANFGQMNKGDWIRSLIADYKKNLNEKKINLDDDYVKFIRYAEHYIEKNANGIVAMITNNSYIDGVTHRRMREHLMNTFDEIYVLNLHGNSLRKEKAPDGSKDENVFDIQQGVAISIFVKKGGDPKKPAVVYQFDLFGLREIKYHELLRNDITSIAWKKLEPKEPYWYFVKKDEKHRSEYQAGFSISDLFPIQNSGIKTDRDDLFIADDPKALADRFRTLLSGRYDEEFKEKYRVIDSGSYRITSRIMNKTFDEKAIKQIMYRPFDSKYIYYDHEIVSRPAYAAMKHILHSDNFCLCFMRQYIISRQHLRCSRKS